jgi:hypothetical protein
VTVNGFSAGYQRAAQCGTTLPATVRGYDDTGPQGRRDDGFRVAPRNALDVWNRTGCNEALGDFVAVIPGVDTGRMATLRITRYNYGGWPRRLPALRPRADQRGRPRLDGRSHPGAR